MKCLPFPSNPPAWRVSSLQKIQKVLLNLSIDTPEFYKDKFKQNALITTKIFTLSVCLLHPCVLLLKICLEVFEDLDFEVD